MTNGKGRKISFNDLNSNDRILIQTWPHKVWATEKMKCADCNECWVSPGSGGSHCIYGGPHVWVDEYFVHPLNVQFFEIQCFVCDLPYKDDKYIRDVDGGFPLYYHKGETYIQFCSCECGLKWQQENKNV